MTRLPPSAARSPWSRWPSQTRTCASTCPSSASRRLKPWLAPAPPASPSRPAQPCCSTPLPSSRPPTASASPSLQNPLRHLRDTRISAKGYYSHTRRRGPGRRRIVTTHILNNKENTMVRKGVWIAVILGIVTACGVGVRVHAADILQAGASAPDFSLPSQEDASVSLSQYKGKWVDRKSVRVGKECRSRWSPDH